MATQCKDYDFTAIEAHWQDQWAQEKTFKAIDGDTQRPKYYVMEMYPYPSGAGLHAGHAENFTGGDVIARYKWATGHNVLHPMGWDAFGLPAEQYAVKTGQHPRVTTQRNVATFTRQLNKLGLAIDWDREINTTDEIYYKWTQWIFLQLYKHGLAYVSEQPVNWCPELGTVLANEEVIDGKSEVGGHPVVRKNLRQWVLRITAYAEKLLQGLEKLDWPESSKKQQAHWIGRSTGAQVVFDIEEQDAKIEVYTTRPDTLFGVTYMVLSPEHKLVQQLTTGDQRELVDAYIEAAAKKSDLERTELAKIKTGVFTGSYAINPVNGKRVPIWIADYVLASYGTGAIMAVPAQDERDWDFAETYDLPIVRTVQPPEDFTGKAYTGDGPCINSDFLNGLQIAEAKEAMIKWLEQHQRGEAQVNYRLRDWLFSRQRYWGEPFPIVFVDEAAYRKARELGGVVARDMPEETVSYEDGGQTYYALPIPAEQLPLVLPRTENYKPSGTGESPLSKVTEWVDVWFNLETGETVSRTETQPAGDAWVPASRETNTMPQWAGSCWYYLRYLDPKNTEQLIAPEIRDYWGSVDFYMGGTEHVTLHLLYARFWHQFLVDIGVLKEPEPFLRLYHQGIILGEDGEKMSKSRGNVVNPDDYIQEFGADALRAYLMFMGPLDDMKPWKTDGIKGVFRFLQKVWNEFAGRDGAVNSKVQDEGEEQKDTLKLLHETIKKVGDDMEHQRFNTALSQMMIFMNHVAKAETVQASTARAFVQLLAPICPHISEELWQRLGGEGTVAKAQWPKYDAALLESAEVKIGLLINGKPRGEAMVAKDATQAQVLEQAKADPKVAPHLEGKTVRKVIYVPGKILNVVAN
ncbi:MAG: leucyl-tRNA synthetase [Puniceicoccaceae bacterium 5H]|nr:MAG: leucyl-tRNA synthetase [Puniceicoccaceae bacterium 5H]